MTQKSELGILLQVISWIVVTTFLYTVLRLEFLGWNWITWFRNIPSEGIFTALIQGVRFDLSSITWLSALVLIATFLPWPSIALSLKEQTLRVSFFLIHIPFLVFNVIDIDFIHFAGRRLTPDSFYLLHESQGKFSAIVGTYWHLLLFNLILFSTYVWFIQNLRFQIGPQRVLSKLFSHWKGRIPASFLFLLILVIFARGGLQPKPLEMAHASAMNSDIRLVHLTLNSSFTTIHSLQKKHLSRLNYFTTSEELIPLLNSESAGNEAYPWSRKPKNVVLFILESFGLEYTGLDNTHKQSFTPFLDSLKPQSIYFQNSFANGRRSIEALPSLLAGIPSLLDEPFVTSNYQTNNIPRIGTELQSRGIWTAFFHGGANGTMFFQEFTQRLGFQQYFGKNEYPKSGDDDGSWGIWDGPFLNYFGEQLKQKDSSFFAVFFSLSSHHPYKVPTEWVDKLPQGPLPILQSVAYTDQMLREFFQNFKNTPWFKDTLFIFTADHTSKSYLPNYQTPLASFRVPILVYFPGAELNSNKNKLDLLEPVQHIDIFPTVTELLGAQVPYPKLARPLFKTGHRKVSTYLDGQQYLIERDSQLVLPTEGALPLSDSVLLPAWKAHRQYFINGLLDNQWILPNE